MGKVLIITTSIRAKSNSDILAEKVAEGAKETGHDVEMISLTVIVATFFLMKIKLQKRYTPDKFTFDRLKSEYGIYIT